MPVAPPVSNTERPCNPYIFFFLGLCFMIVFRFGACALGPAFEARCRDRLPASRMR
jgi:hypothetical protein